MPVGADAVRVSLRHVLLGGWFGCVIACCLSALPSAARAQVSGMHEAPRHSHQLGVQAGGSAFLVFDYRFRFAGPLWLDLGLGAAPHAVGNATAGLVIDIVEGRNWVFYAGAGATAGILDQRSVAFGYGRIGMGWKFGSEKQHRLSFDTGGWIGAWWSNENGQTERHPLRVPMAGLSYLVGL